MRTYVIGIALEDGLELKVEHGDDWRYVGDKDGPVVFEHMETGERVTVEVTKEDG